MTKRGTGYGASRVRHRFGRSAGGARYLVPFLLLLFIAPAPLAAQRTSATEKEIAESQRRLEQIRKERAQLREEMSRIRSRVTGLSGELRNLQGQVGAAAGLVEELDRQVAQREAQITANTRELLATQDRLAERQALVQRRLRDLYKRGPLHTAQVLLTADSFSDLLNRYRYLFLVARRDRALLGEVASLQSQLVSRERALRSSLFELQGVMEQKTSEHAEFARLEDRQRKALSSMQARERTTSRRIDQLARDEKQLTGVIAALETKRKEAERLAAERRRASGRAAAPAERSTLTTADLGKLGWPVDGRVLYRFGRSTQPNGTVIRWNGVGIGAAAGTRVQAVEDGTVVMAGPFEGYGPTVIVSHGGGYYSLYLYLREVSVKEGDAVTRSQAVGTVGGERTPEGAHLEFQIRAPGGAAVDPLAWLQARNAS